ncbi:hypothetical protein CORC01_05223 [Colletotrichum orchidophilum]|uniref:Uncharacterized protein n=1 Tax=Colletotrichum orchidophilum TaxID=1209926 RepID=A0A1G4BDI1_9PEZI|nr:uncharacterized protein CORC01_05223 [Colletotrichum orchidophilum]OHE99423.1 hypothetical protein CORC01_05223 [Colletotrichum orchidophilum]
MTCEDILSGNLAPEDDFICTIVHVTPRHPQALAMQAFLEKFLETEDKAFDIYLGLSNTSTQTAFRCSAPFDVLDEEEETTFYIIDASDRWNEGLGILARFRESDAVEYEDGLYCDAFDNFDFRWKELTYLGVMGDSKYLEQDLIQQIHDDMNDQEKEFASRSIPLEEKQTYHNVTWLDCQAYNDETFGDRHEGSVVLGTQDQVYPPSHEEYSSLDSQSLHQEAEKDE